MMDLDTFLTTRYVMADDWCQSHLDESQPARDDSCGRYSKLLRRKDDVAASRTQAPVVTHQGGLSLFGAPVLLPPLLDAISLWHCRNRWEYSHADTCALYRDERRSLGQSHEYRGQNLW